MGGLFFARQTARDFRERPPIFNRQTDVSVIESWMTLKYISRSFGVPEIELEKQLELPALTYQKSNLNKIAKDTNQDTEVLIQKIQKIVVEFQATHPTPPPR